MKKPNRTIPTLSGKRTVSNNPSEAPFSIVYASYISQARIPIVTIEKAIDMFCITPAIGG
jgi:hypothetical protein